MQELQLKNWDNFCTYHANNDWYGIWTEYNPDRQVVKSFQCIRSFHVSEDESEIHHQNHYTYADGTQETKTFGPYKKPITKSLFLDNSFSWGSIKVESNLNFGFETGFRYEDRRVSVVVVYDESGSLQKIVVIREHLATFSMQMTNQPVKELSRWQKTSKTMTPDWIVSSPVVSFENPTEHLSPNYYNLNLFTDISITCPKQVEGGKEFFAAVDWLIEPNLLQRGIRQYNESGFTQLTLDILNTIA
jgi:Domain of unknown function (DUF3598)